LRVAARFSELKQKALHDEEILSDRVIQEAGLDGFWLHRALEQEGSKATLSIGLDCDIAPRRRLRRQDRRRGAASHVTGV